MKQRPVLGLAKPGPCISFFLMFSSTPNIYIKMMRRLFQFKIQPLWWPEKRGPSFFTQKSHFQPIFDPKHLENTIEILLNQSMATKKP
jgi:hypothetical protein